MEKVRLGIIGMGNIGKYHADYLQARKISRCELVAVCDAVAHLGVAHIDVPLTPERVWQAISSSERPASS